jgi:hypothetical protein
VLNKIVLHVVGGNVRKGTTEDFSPAKDFFHVKENDSGAVSMVNFSTLKAVFFVKDFDGNREYQERTDVERVGFGKKIRVLYRDGETQVGYTQGFSPARPGFFLFPVDPSSNNDRIFVITGATQDIQFI